MALKSVKSLTTGNVVNPRQKYRLGNKYSKITLSNGAEHLMSIT